MSDYFTWVKAIWVTGRGTPLDFTSRKYLVQIYQDQHPSIVFMKAAQMGMSERGISESVWVPDVLGKNVLYTFPSMAQLQDFVQARIDPVIASSEYLYSRTSETDKSLSKIGLKRFGKGHLYLRGSQNEKQIISVDADMVILDERDRFDQDNVPYIDKRLLASDLRWRREISTPTIPGIGIHAAFTESDQRVWQVPCSECGHWQELDFFKNIDFEKRKLICVKCKSDKIDRLADGKWEITNPGPDVHGYKINGIYNPMRSIEELIKEYDKAQTEGYSSVQQFYNQVLGYPYEITGQSLGTEEVDACKRDFYMPTTKYQKNQVYLGCDVGVDQLHVCVVEKISDEKMRLLWAGTVRNFFGPMDSLERIVNMYGIKYGVIDKKPETSQVRKMVEMFPGRIYAAGYPNMKFSVKDYYIYDDVRYEVQIDRTISLDYLINDIQNQRIELPANVGMIDGFYDQLLSSVRVTDRNKKTGVDQARWVEKGADHYLHTLNYARIAQIRGVIGKALLDYYVKPEESLAPNLVDWIRVNGQRIG